MQTAEAKLNASSSGGGAASGATPASKKKGSLPNGSSSAAPPNPAVLALAPNMERGESMASQAGTSQTDKDDTVGMMSPESIAQ